MTLLPHWLKPKPKTLTHVLDCKHCYFNVLSVLEKTLFASSVSTPTKCVVGLVCVLQLLIRLTMEFLNDMHMLAFIAPH